MKKLLFIIAILFTSSMTFAQNTYVSGYTRSNGTYVSGYIRNATNQTYPLSIRTATVYRQTVNIPSSTIYTGSRGGQYYINSNGNKTYLSY
jgi:hypothetical protein